MTMKSYRAILKAILSLTAFLLLAWDLQAANDWPGFRGPNADGSVAGQKFAPSQGGQLAVNWRAAIGPGYSGISVIGDRAVTLFSDGTSDVVAAFDMKTGKELWRTAIASTYKGHDGSHDGPIATPTISDGKAFALFPEGQLVAADLATGKQLWKVNLAENGGKKPFYGFTASPVVAAGVVVVEIGGEAGKAVAGFDAQTGKLKWTSGNGAVNYQSPLLFQSGERQLVLAASDKQLFVLDPATGKMILEYEHGGDDSASVMVPVLLDQGRVLLRNKENSSDLIRLNSNPDGTITVEKLWTKDIFKNSYCIPVYYKGYLFGFNGRVLTSVDATTGEIKWRSRAVGDGWLLLVDGNLVVQSKMGTLHIGPASPDGWTETAKIDLFKDVSWTPPSFAGGTILTRSQKELVRLEWLSQPAKTAISATSTVPTSSQFGKFLTELQSTQDKKGAVDRFMASQKSFPLIEWPDRVTFVYRGPADDVAIAGDLQGSQREDSLQRVPETDLFYYTARLEPDARINYRYVKNFDEMISDPNNPRATKDRRGNPLSWVGMPAWEYPSHLNAPPEGKRGKIEKQEVKSKLREGAYVKFDVYLPVGYDQAQTRFPVVYIFDGAQAQIEGLVVNTLDNVLGNTVQPLIAVFLTEVKTNLPEDQQSEETKTSTQMLVQEVIPFVDSKYRTVPEGKSRALMGPLFNGFNALFAALQQPDMFGGVALQSIWLDTQVETTLKPMIRNADEHPLQIYLDWGLYDARSYVEGWNLQRDNEKFDEYLRERGYRPAGGEVHDSYGWAAWRNRTDRWLATLFPASSQNP